MTVVIIVVKKPFYLWLRFKFIDIPEYKRIDACLGNCATKIPKGKLES
jgi:hypothetical protein